MTRMSTDKRPKCRNRATSSETFMSKSIDTERNANCAK
jgi:hypothetical protein